MTYSHLKFYKDTSFAILSVQMTTDGGGGANLKVQFPHH